MRTYLAIFTLALAGCATSLTPQQVAALTPEERTAYIQGKLIEQRRVSDLEGKLFAVGELYIDGKTGKLLASPKKHGTAK